MFETATTHLNAAAADAVAQAESALSTATAALDTAQAGVAEVTDRIAALEAQKTQIITERPADAAGRLTLINADIDSIRPLLTERNAEFDAAAIEVGKQREVLRHAAEMLKYREDRDLLERLVDHAKKLDELMTSTVTEINSISSRCRLTKQWQPSGVMADLVRKADLQFRGI